MMIDLRSDTVTQPTEEMREAMKNAEVGDDVYGDDPTVKELERRAAAILGKEASLFVPSGTFGNQLALLTHCRRGEEVILGDDCHIVVHEAGAAAVIPAVQLRTVESVKGRLSPEKISRRIRRGEDIHCPRTGLICLENAHSLGTAVSPALMEEIYAVAKEAAVPVHLDGARIFNAALALKTDAGEIARFADTVMFCLSKGLCAPAGSLLAGSAAFIDAARRNRKLMGGGLRQAGVLAAPGLVALEKMTARLAEDHANARFLARRLASVPGVRVWEEHLQINMVFFTFDTPFPAGEPVAELARRRIRISEAEDGVFRLVTHYGITEEDVRYAAGVFAEVLGRLSVPPAEKLTEPVKTALFSAGGQE